MTDLYNYYDRFLPSMNDSEFDNLPSPRVLLEATDYFYHQHEPSFVDSIPIIDAGVEHNGQNRYVVVQLGSEHVKISASYDGEYGLDYNYDVSIVMPQQTTMRTWLLC